MHSKALKIESPCEITKSEFTEAERKIKEYVDLPRGSVFQYPKCKKEAKAYDTTEKQWRHWNFFNTHVTW